MPEPWPFCELPAERIVVQNELAFGIRDGCGRSLARRRRDWDLVEEVKVWEKLPLAESSAAAGESARRYRI